MVGKIKKVWRGFKGTCSKVFSPLLTQWTEAGYAKRFAIAVIVIPWTPIILLALALCAPPEVMTLVEINGKLFGAVAGSSWELAAAFFKNALAGMI